MVEGVAHGLVEVPYHLAVVVTKLSKAQRMTWDCVGQDHHQNVSSRIKRSLGSARGAIPGPPTRAPGGNDDICTRLKGCRPSATISLAAVATCVRQPLSEILQSAAAGRWRRARPRRLHARLLSCASLQRRLVVVLVVSFPWWCGGTSSLPGSSSFSSSNVVVIVLNVSENSNIAGARNCSPVCALVSTVR